MKKLLLAIFAVTSVGFAADRVVTITPNVEASGMLRPNDYNTFVKKVKENEKNQRISM